ncbi:MAG: tetratricopeptide repeat protein [Candidatus Koribacter versatilis]|nr:tetratricopeptide repeat protein [Candidatus Koribacter versatilis]
MTDTNKTADQWTSVQAYTLAVVCLLIGIAGGWFIRGSQAPVASGPVESANATAPAGMGGQPVPSPAQLKQMADTQAAPLLEKLKSDANNAGLLAEIGNVYYDTQQYPTAIDYYGRALKIAPENASVRTDLGTAMWYLGNADGAIEQFNQALKYEPNKANALFNLGIVKWQGKMDVDGAVAAWQKLLATNPNYEAKDKVEQLMAQAKKHSNVKPGTPAKPLAE